MSYTQKLIITHCLKRKQKYTYYVLFLHLNDLPAFLKVLPSKLFEYAATGKPLLAGVKGYCRSFLTEQLEGIGVFDPCDIEGAITAFEGLELDNYPRTAFCEKYARQRIMDEMALDILECGKSAKGAIQ